ncbi:MULTISPECIES: UDP-N-acetylmuramate dehydrogenase [Paenibacillus]|uniref:UDP-N-acetylmuramate dehydrogenase n=1 Tax=Paenibacillus TaxID=44249 RepID=UPI000B8868D5|nr:MULTISPECIES: UDP-N-acetylmuramate dehydrogenase [Paenibacillus]MBD8837403.1 UDP-N-acetylmuramate dehydrogenase [Paenibacillus sp. CFBP 13594]MDQ0720601.1 UDP-N-acetylmuramate dehydrogenase [Paenibacillus sp. W4I10]MDR6716841.1 UDP-N-acetylmuramate dehydrogenase [Paenibacillus sp. 2003]PRA07368.1 UDP-N-acetylenolpyruvoylglucosamine reductase [Paenibacillus sp. MYb63]PRA51012.1 UDP-N-acetylenolpyruvoylglucosamine reductase [Paenibacillus sp. MYb67]
MNIFEQHIPLEKVKFNEPLKNHTFIKIGGKADILIHPTTIDEITKIVEIANIHQLPLTVIGKGSNVIIKDGGIRGVTISLSHFDQIKVSEDSMIAQSGVDIIDVSRLALEHSLTGLEFACGIPGSTGGALYMNAGAYGGQIADVVERATVITKDGAVLEIPREEMKFGYRNSLFKMDHYIILEAEFGLKKGNKEDIASKMKELTFLRESKQPLEFPSCGSVFKRPEGHFAGKLIQDCNLQGTRIGGAEISMKHAGFIVNVDHATAQDYMDLIQFIQKKVYDTFQVELETEVIFLGE